MFSVISRYPIFKILFHERIKQPNGIWIQSGCGSVVAGKQHLMWLYIYIDRVHHIAGCSNGFKQFIKFPDLHSIHLCILCLCICLKESIGCKYRSHIIRIFKDQFHIFANVKYIIFHVRWYDVPDILLIHHWENQIKTYSAHKKCRT